MAIARSKTRAVCCIACEGDRDLREHHVLGYRNVPTAVVFVCHPRHDHIHERLRRIGVPLDTDRSAEPAALLYAVIGGLSVLLEDITALSDNPSRAVAETREMRQEAALMLRATSGEAIIAGSLLSRAHRRNPTASRPVGCDPCRPRSEAERFARAETYARGLFPALAATITHLFGGERRAAAFVGQARSIAAHVDELMSATRLLDRHPRSADFSAELRVAIDQNRTLLQKLAGHARGRVGKIELRESLVKFHEMERRWLPFTEALCEAGDDASRVDAAVLAMLDGRRA